MKPFKKSLFLIPAFCLTMFLLLQWSCKKDDSVVPDGISTLAIIEITNTSAKSGGNISRDGGGKITERGLVWHTSTGPTREHHTGLTNNGEGLGIFTSEISGLSPNILYYVRAYATNSTGTAYGNEQQFTTDGTATVTTANITNITPVSATGGGNVITDGNPPVSSRGIIWNTTPSPTVENYQGITNHGTGTGNFTSEITGLIPGTTYYARAYATNSISTVYGAEVSFSAIGSVTDADGNEYKIVVIGDQVWMAENLKTGKYKNGSPIPTGYSGSEWGSLTSAAYAIYPHSMIDGLNSEAEVLGAYGALYNWFAVETGNLCPAGWRVPSDAEWTTLTNYIGGLSTAGGKLKSTRTMPDANPSWLSPNTGSTDEYGFSALPGGYRTHMSSGEFSQVKYYTHFWSRTAHNSSASWSRSIYYNQVYMDHYNRFNRSGLSIRCIMDN